MRTTSALQSGRSHGHAGHLLLKRASDASPSPTRGTSPSAKACLHPEHVASICALRTRNDKTRELRACRYIPGCPGTFHWPRAAGDMADEGLCLLGFVWVWGVFVVFFFCCGFFGFLCL